MNRGRMEACDNCGEAYFTTEEQPVHLCDRCRVPDDDDMPLVTLIRQDDLSIPDWQIEAALQAAQEDK